jgi:hypothetical protein
LRKSARREVRDSGWGQGKGSVQVRSRMARTEGVESQGWGEGGAFEWW